jgi:ATP-dependent Clp protease ATP-binding subunit ClpA
VLDYLGEQGFDPQFGARPLKRVLQRVILNELSKDALRRCWRMAKSTSKTCNCRRCNLSFF